MYIVLYKALYKKRKLLNQRLTFYTQSEQIKNNFMAVRNKRLKIQRKEQTALRYIGMRHATEENERVPV